MRSNHARNQLLRSSFRERSTAIDGAVEKKLNTAFVPTPRVYRDAKATDASRAHARKIARVQVGFDKIWTQFGSRVPEWTETFNLLKKMTPKRSDLPNMAAVRIVLPESWDMATGSKRLEFVDSTTGVAAKLRVIPDHHNPSAIVLRGESTVLAKAADELIASCPEIEVFTLGDVATFDYDAKRLWPAIKESPDGGLTVPIDRQHNIWMHKELETHWVDRPYEQTPKPKQWTSESFEGYIMALVCGKLRPHLAMRYYKKPRQDGKLVDTDGIRVSMILGAFEDPSARECITPSVLTMAVAFMAQRGGHRASADRLFNLAEDWGLPMDTDMFNVMLEGYVAKRDAGFFHRMVEKMEGRYFRPNARTWLHFLKLVQRDDERRQVIAAMYELGLFEDPATRRGIAAIMASYDAYAAFRAGKSLDTFLGDQTMRYGDDWPTRSCVNRVLREYLRSHDRTTHDDFDQFKRLLDLPAADGRPIDTSTYNIVLGHCAARNDWDTAIWALGRIADPDPRTYNLLIQLCMRTRCTHTLGVVLFYAALERKLRGQTRLAMQRVLLHSGTSASPKIFNSKMAWSLRQHKITRDALAVAGVEWAVLNVCDGYKPLKPLAEAVDVVYRTFDTPMLRHMRQATDVDSSVSLRDYAVKLRDPTGQKPPLMVHLDAAFTPDSMMRDWAPDEPAV